MSYLGLDLGAGFAKVARTRLDSWLGPGGTPNVITVQSAMSYNSGGGMAIPPDGYPAGPQRGTARCDGFAVFLGTTHSFESVPAWDGKTPNGVTKDFLRCLLDEVEADGDDPLTDPDDGSAPQADLVVAVPPGARAPYHAAGLELQSALGALDWQPKRLIAAPVAALLWLRHRDPALNAARRILVIDVGAGSAEFSLCTASRGAVRVVDSDRVTGGAQESQPAALVEDLVGALAAAAEVGREEPGRDRARLWRAFEAALADDAVRERMDVALQQAAMLRQRYGTAPALRFAGTSVTASDVLEAADPLAERLVGALANLLGRQEDPAWRGFRPGANSADRVVLLGGLTVLRPLRTALLSFLGLDPGCLDGAGGLPGPDNSAGVHWPAGRDLTESVACGAALLAAGLADAGDRYPYGLRLVVHRQVRAAVVAEYLSLATPGSVNLELDQTEYLIRVDASGEGYPVTITVPAAAEQDDPGPDSTVPVPVEIIRGDGDVVPASFRPAPPPSPGTYWIGVRGGPGGPAIVLAPAPSGQPLAYPLADLDDPDDSESAPPAWAAE
jgi:hypothetical protein